jgi:hypothetical protein
MAKRVYNIREGWRPDDDWLPGRLLTEPLTLPSGRTAAPTRDRLRAMIDSYYKMRASILRDAQIWRLSPTCTSVKRSGPVLTFRFSRVMLRQA